MNPDHLIGALAVLVSAFFLYPPAVVRVLVWIEQRGTTTPDPIDVAQQFHDDLDTVAAADVIAAAETLAREAAS